jgi:hypothetical protein
MSETLKQLKMVLSKRSEEKERPMFSLTHKTCTALLASGLIALSSFATPVCAEDLVEHLGPVGPHEPILTNVGSKRVLAFYTPGENACALQAIVWTKEEDTTSPARVRVSMDPGAIVHIDSPENESLNLQCGDGAKKLAVVEDDRLAAFGIAIEKPMQTVSASAGAF